MTNLTFFQRHQRYLTRAAVVLLSTLTLSSCMNDDDDTDITPVVTEGPELVSFTQANLYPEGVEYDTGNRRFLVSSQTTGNISQVREDGSFAPFATDASLVSTTGLQIDVVNNRLLVAVSDPGYNTTKSKPETKGKLAGLAGLSVTGQLLSYVDLGILAPNLSHFANDIAVDQLGNAYVTDSFSPIIYRVDPQGRASIFLQDARLGAPAGKFGLNGIEFHPDGYLLVAKTDDGSLFKVPISNPTSFTKVASSQDLVGIDGIQLQDVNTLYAVTNSQAKVYRLTTTNAWVDATAAGTFATPPQYPTTLARRSTAETYVLYSNLNALQANQTPPVSVFGIAKVKF
ncbi:gluconolaconase [Hymenobacter lucidus]|uniref:Gluconolaconase n=1 Tax=Hymenobacter lucidus TaxID=2880930 RepID=A0ABS8AVD3_9BACT|nr:gluconolaconase [Hymenobacter lucidus]MCB2409067.1 gluconolaconase [Hymenobacter lucidus]